MPYAGHFNPTQTLVIELVKRGHEVLWVTGKAYKEKALATGARFGLMSDDAILEAMDEKECQSSTPAKFDPIEYLRILFLDRIPAQVEDFQKHLETFPADILLVEFAVYGARTLSDLIGIPYVTLGINPLFTLDPEIPSWGLGWQPPKTCFGRWINSAVHFLAQRGIYSKMEVLLTERRREAGVGPLPPGIGFQDAFFSRYAHIMMTTPALEFPRRNLGSYVKFVGPLLPTFDESSFVPPGWWDELLAHPRERVVHVTQGTLSKYGDNLLRPSVLGLASHPDLLVVVTGKRMEEALGEDFPLPSNVRTATFVPHPFLLPYVGVMVTNGGYNGILAAISHGVPLVCAGKTEDKADTSSRVAWAGAGIDLRTDRPTPSAVRDAVLSVCRDHRYKEAAERGQAGLCDARRAGRGRRYHGEDSRGEQRLAR